MSRRRTGDWRFWFVGALWGGLLGAPVGWADEADQIPGTRPLVMTEPLDVVMVNGINTFALRELEESRQRRETIWKRDYSSAEAYAKSVAANRQRFVTSIGAVDPRVHNPAIELLVTTERGSQVAAGAGFEVHAVRWRVLEGVTAEGLLLQPTKAVTARAVVLPDADWTPEQFAGLVAGGDAKSLIPKRLAENGVQVLVPTLISRDDTFSGSPYVAFTNQSHREYVYRMSFEMGRHVIGYEVQKVLAAVDLFSRLNESEKLDLPIGVAGVGEGGLLALYSGAVDPRIDAVMVSGYFQQREAVWEEPIYRNVWGLLTEFGDADLASLIAPRLLIIEAAGIPESKGPVAPKPGRRGGAAPGKIQTATLASVRLEVDRAKPHFEKLNAADKLFFRSSGEGNGLPGTDVVLAEFLKGLGIAQLAPSGQELADVKVFTDPIARQQAQIKEMTVFTQNLLRLSSKVRDQLWSKAKRSSVEDWVATADELRQLVYGEMIGKLPESTMPLNPRTRPFTNIEPNMPYKAYEVVLDVYPDVIAGGVLLIPNDLKPGEKRPVVVCQHGLEGVPVDTIRKDVDGFKYYSAFASELCRRGFITYAPQNPYRGQDRFRTLQRKSNPMKRSLYSYIIPQHQRTLDWLASLPFVDSSRLAFYGLSYGGKTAVRVPPMLVPSDKRPGYCLSICSADYNEWVKKNTSDEDGYSYVFTGEYEIFEWNMGHVANYAELSYLMTPRPFMVERGHDDGVAPDEWVAWEYSKVKRHYDKLGIGNRSEIEFFIGPHTINGQATYEFLHRHLNWPKR
ncbi:MAG: alpha/beta hydrolase family protein [Planctomycetaceae bacterium]